MKKGIAQIRAEFEAASACDREKLIEEYQTDDRKGVQNLIAKYERQKIALENERLRLEKMRFFEKKYGQQYIGICGIDEAGRGPLAGPVVAGACILPENVEILYLNDSKKLSAKRREALYAEICEKAISYGVGIVSPEEIDRVNILQATYEAMRAAIAAMSVSPDLLLVDAVTIPKVSVKQVGIIRGDEKSVSIAAASILAKVTRDQIMREYDKVYPEYHFADNKGYGSAGHIEALQKIGPCPIHRRTFIKNFIVRGQ